MKIYVTENYEQMSRKAAAILAAQLIQKPDSVLGLATGSTPIGTYQALIAACRSGDLDFSAAKSVNLDEYLGLAPDHDQSYRYFMQTNLFDHINIDPANTHVPDGLAVDGDAECARYDQLIADLGGIDIQVVGIGHNGHIAFNEPDDHFPLGTHVVELQESTITANSRFFASPDEVPRRALSMGIGSIMAARTVLMVVNGEGKADIIKKAFSGPVTPQVPASILQLHPNFILVGDRAALSKL